MNTIKLYMIVVFVLVLALTACSTKNPIAGSGNIITERRSVSNFNRVTLSGFGQLNIQQGDKESLTVITDDNIMPYIQTQVSAGTLIINFENGGQDSGFQPSDGIEFNLVVKDLDRLDIYGAGNINVEALQTEKLLVDLTGVGSLKISSLDIDGLVVRAVSKFVQVDVSTLTTGRLGRIGDHRAQGVLAVVRLESHLGLGVDDDFLLEFQGEFVVQRLNHGDLFLGVVQVVGHAHADVSFLEVTACQGLTGDRETESNLPRLQLRPEARRVRHESDLKEIELQGIAFKFAKGDQPAKFGRE